MRFRALPALAAAATRSLVAGCSESASAPPDASPAATSAPAAPAEPPASASSDTSASAEPSPSSSANGDDVVANPPKKTWKDALKAAKKEFPGDVSEIELESEEGSGLEWKIELKSSKTE